MRPGSSALRQAPADSGGEGEGEGGETDTALHARAPLRRGEAAGLRSQPPQGQLLEVAEEGFRVGQHEGHAGLHGRPSPGRLGGEEEDEAAHQAEVEEEGIDPAEDTLARPALGQASRDPDDLQQVGQDRLVDPRGEHLAHEEGGEVGPLARELLEGPEEGPEAVGGALRAGLDRPEPLGQRGEGRLEDRDVEAPLAPEVVADEGLVDAGARGHLLDGDAVEPPLGEQLGPGLQQGLPGGQGVALLPLPWGARSVSSACYRSTV